MKKILFAFILGLSICFQIKAQQATPLAANVQANVDNLAQKMAKKMKDSLNLSGKEYQAIMKINKEISEQKLQLRKKFPNNMDSLIRNTQRIENTRDTLYKAILSKQQFSTYLTKKRNLIRNN
jgi:hypothetical protein